MRLTRRLTKHFLLMMLLAIGMAVAFSSHAQLLTKAETSLDIEYTNSEQKLSLDEVTLLDGDLWSELKTDRASFGYTTDEYWFRFQLKDSNIDRVLHIAYPLLDELNIYIQTDAGIKTYKLGDTKPFHERPIPTSEFAVPLPKGTSGTVYLSASSQSSMRLPIAVRSNIGFFETQMNRRIAEGIYFGVLLCMAVYNLFGFVASREPEFGLYSLYTVFFAGLMLSLEGLGFHYLWPESIYLQDKGIPIFGSLTFLTAALFAYQLLELKRYRNTLGRGLMVMAFLSAASLVVGIFASYRISIHVLLILAAPGCFFLLLVGAYLWRKGFLYARIFTLAWCSLLLSVVANSLGYLGVIDSMFIQRHAIMLGSGIEILLLSWVLAVRYNEQRKERLAAQKKYNQELEENVEERTFELQIALRELQDVNSELEQKNMEDPLTGLYNRRYFQQHLERELRRTLRRELPLALLMIDVDRFKPINDTHGHMVGDQILKQLANLMRQHAKRAADVVCRYGGEEFAIILPETDLDDARIFAEQLLSMVREHAFETDVGEQRISISAGVISTSNRIFDNVDELFKAADEALYTAKNQGRDQVAGQ
ncbi:MULTISPECIES: diguanylate cyclase [unclassified Idiomarina]|uniref:sensor domain-containing diguanylate cyclase n=1 Tax=unclassified Idiomarina TaxID=2614829 RepID=UPI000A6DF326|nr:MULTISPECIES: diguanylate cyclase [unclassified Idiomarina]MCJ8317162.1 sensor domain-containing diguanylate cyclase [Idiomarina sp.]